MRSGYKINENALTRCNKCDCLILSDSSDSKNDKCIKSKNTRFGPKPEKRKLPAGDADSNDSNEGVVLKNNRQSSVKIIVNAQTDSCSNDDSSLDKTASSDSDTIPCKTVKTDFSMKHICFRFCRKKKDNKEAATAVSAAEVQAKDDANQTSAVAVPDCKDCTEPNINDLLQKYCNCKGAGGGCNTNTIIFPRDKICGDGLSNLENCIKVEARNHTRNLEEILNELYKQRREIREIRDLLDAVVRTMREHLPAPAFQAKKPCQDMFEEYCRKTCLERKSNTLSIAGPEKNRSPTEVNEPPFTNTKVTHTNGDKPKKKGLFAWCK